MSEIKVTPELLSILESCANITATDVGTPTGVIHALIAEIRHQWAGGWTRITDDASLPEVGRPVVLCYCNGIISGEVVRHKDAKAGEWIWNVGDYWRYATPMPGEG